jgi:hypothetical protein
VLLFVTVLLRKWWVLLLGELLLPCFCAAFVLLGELSFVGEEEVLAVACGLLENRSDALWI